MNRVIICLLSLIGGALSATAFANKYVADGPLVTDKKVIAAICADAFNPNPGFDENGISPEKARTDEDQRKCGSGKIKTTFEKCIASIPRIHSKRVAYVVGQRNSAELQCRGTLESAPIDAGSFEICVSTNGVREKKFLSDSEIQSVMSCFKSKVRSRSLSHEEEHLDSETEARVSGHDSGDAR